VQVNAAQRFSLLWSFQKHVIEELEEHHKGHDEKDRFDELGAVFDGQSGTYYGAQDHEDGDGDTDEVIDLAVDGESDEGGEVRGEIDEFCIA